MPVNKVVSTFSPFVCKNGVAILDGGMTTALPPEAGKHFLWGTQLLFSHQGLQTLYDVHQKFLESGADAIETLSYKLSSELITQCHEKGWMDNLREEIMLKDPNDWVKTGIDSTTNLPTMDELYQRSISTATKARDDYVEKTNPEMVPLVIGCLAPYADACNIFHGQTDPNTSSRKESVMEIEKSKNLRNFDAVEVQAMHNYYKQKLTSMCINSNVKPDMISFETLPSAKEALIALEEMSLVNDHVSNIIPCNVTFIPHPEFGPDKINRGDHLADAVDEVIRFIHGKSCTASNYDWQNVNSKHCGSSTIPMSEEEPSDGGTRKLNVLLSGIGCNCFNPNMTNTIAEIVKETIDETYEDLKMSSNEHHPEIIVYPNSGEFWDGRPEHRSWHVKEEDDMKYLEGKDAREFHEHGATVIGGCCRVTCAQIEKFANEFKQ